MKLLLCLFWVGIVAVAAAPPLAPTITSVTRNGPDTVKVMITPSVSASAVKTVVKVLLAPDFATNTAVDGCVISQKTTSCIIRKPVGVAYGAAYKLSAVAKDISDDASTTAEEYPDDTQTTIKLPPFAPAPESITFNDLSVIPTAGVTQFNVTTSNNFARAVSFYWLAFTDPVLSGTGQLACTARRAATVFTSVESMQIAPGVNVFTCVAGKLPAGTKKVYAVAHTSLGESLPSALSIPFTPVAQSALALPTVVVQGMNKQLRVVFTPVASGLGEPLIFTANATLTGNTVRCSVTSDGLTQTPVFCILSNLIVGDYSVLTGIRSASGVLVSDSAIIASPVSTRCNVAPITNGFCYSGGNLRYFLDESAQCTTLCIPGTKPDTTAESTPATTCAATATENAASPINCKLQTCADPEYTYRQPVSDAATNWDAALQTTTQVSLKCQRYFNVSTGMPASCADGYFTPTTQSCVRLATCANREACEAAQDATIPTCFPDPQSTECITAATVSGSAATAVMSVVGSVFSVLSTWMMMRA